MRRSHRTPDGEDEEPSLFDLPLGSDRGHHGDRAEPSSAGSPEPSPALAAVSAPAKKKDRPAPRPVPKPAPPEAPPAAGEAEGERVAGLKSRFLAGAADVLVHATIVVAAVAGSRLLGAQPASSDWPAIALFLLTFSFLYTVLPLAFWGQTLGMAWAGLIARSGDGEALTFDQTARRWLGGLFTAATLGVPLLATAGGRSLSDRISGSSTHGTS